MTIVNDNVGGNDCPLCNHSTEFHIFIKEMRVTICKVRHCKCYQHRPLYDFSDKVLEEMR